MLVRQQILRGIRRSALSLVASEAAQYGLTCADIVHALVRAVKGSDKEEVSPQFARQFNEFLLTTGIPTSDVMTLLLQIAEGGDGMEEWEIEDLQVMVNAYARGPRLMPGQVAEIHAVVRYMERLTRQRTRLKPRLDALIQQANGIPSED